MATQDRNPGTPAWTRWAWRPGPKGPAGRGHRTWTGAPRPGGGGVSGRAVEGRRGKEVVPRSCHGPPGKEDRGASGVAGAGARGGHEADWGGRVGARPQRTGPEARGTHVRRPRFGEPARPTATRLAPVGRAARLPAGPRRRGRALGRLVGRPCARARTSC
jgi:hypothetical protein